MALLAKLKISPQEEVAEWFAELQAAIKEAQELTGDAK